MAGRLRVLCVDDERVARTAMAETLRARGADVEAEADPRVALQRLHAERFDVLVTDLSMPSMDGIELVSRARGLPDPPGCVLVTALSGSSLDLSALPLGTVAGVVSKPFTGDELWEVVDQARRAAKNRAGSVQSPATINLLLVEDDSAQSQLVGALLERAGLQCEVTVCGRLDDALELLASQRFGMALVDLNLPDARGLDVVRRMRTVSPETPVVVLSEEGRTWGEAAIDLGAQEVLLKSEVNMTELVGAVQRALKRRSAERRAADLAFRDELTGLFNARYFLRRLSETVALSAREGKPSAVLLLDLDGFKPVNDNYGHAAGDAALKEVANRLKSALGEYDTLARLGGDEFAVLVQGVADHEVLGKLAQQLAEVVIEPIHLEQGTIFVGASIGIAVSPECALEPGDLLRAADRAMYAAKAAGKGTVRIAVRGSAESSPPTGIIAPPPTGAPRRWLHTQLDVRDAARRSHRLDLVVFEDFARSTADVLRSLARAGRDIDTLVASLHDAQLALDHSEELRMTIPGELLNTRLLDALRAALATRRARITFEVHAPSLLAGNASHRVMLQMFHDAGFGLCMRDFGTAAIRPDLVADLPLSALRLDPCTIERAAEGGGPQRLLRALVAFGHGLGLEVVIDDLFSNALCERALQAGCDRVLKRQSTREL